MATKKKLPSKAARSKHARPTKERRGRSVDALAWRWALDRLYALRDGVMYSKASQLSDDELAGLKANPDFMRRFGSDEKRFAEAMKLAHQDGVTRAQVALNGFERCLHKETKAGRLKEMMRSYGDYGESPKLRGYRAIDWAVVAISKLWKLPAPNAKPQSDEEWAYFAWEDRAQDALSDAMQARKQSDFDVQELRERIHAARQRGELDALGPVHAAESVVGEFLHVSGKAIEKMRAELRPQKRVVRRPTQKRASS